MRSRRLELIICLFLIVATLAIYWQAGNHEFVSYDDPTYVTENRFVQKGLTLESISWAFTATHASNWHPLTWLSHMLDCQLFGLNPGMHHLTSLLLHIASSILLFLVFRRMTGALWCSAFVAALFALHPLHVESVAWVAERKDVLSAFFWLLTMWSYTWYVERSGINRYLLVLLFFIMGLMSKPMLVTLPFVLLLLDYWPLGRFQLGQSGNYKILDIPKSPVRRLILEKVPFFVLAMISSVVTFIVQQSGGAVSSLDAIPLKIRTANALVSYVSYIGKMIWPHKLEVIYLHHMLPGWQVAGACLLLLSVSLLVVRIVKKHPYLAVGWLWYLGTLVPVIGLVQVGVQSMADRYTYIPLIGLFIIIAWGVPELVARWRHNKIGLTILAVSLLSVLMATTWTQVRYWKNSITLFQHAIDVTANNCVAHNSLGMALAEQGDTTKAIEHYYEALRIQPGLVIVHNNLGNIMAKQGKLREAIKYYSEAVRIKPDYAKARYNLGIVLAHQGKFREAIKHYSEAVRIKPGYAMAHFKLGFALAQQGSFGEAISHYSKAVRLNPDFSAVVSYNIACMHARQNKIKESAD